MRFLKSILNYLAYSYILIALCAVFMFFQTDILFNNEIHGIYYYVFIFFATLFSYHIYYLKNSFSKPHLFISITSILVAFFAFYKIYTTINQALFICIVFLSFLYLIPAYFQVKNKWIGILKIFFLAIIWFLTTTILPIHYVQISQLQLGYFAHQFLFIWVLCFHFYIQDEVPVTHKKKYLKGLIFLNIFLLFLSLISAIMANSAYFFCDFILLFISVYIYKKQPAKLFYLLIVDGMMLLQTIFVIIAYKLNK